MVRKRVAIVGSGCSGLAALWALHRSTEHEVHLFEADQVLGGHTNTVPFWHGAKKVMVDTGFIVYNIATYPNFIKFLETLGIESAPTEMTFGVSRDRGLFEWSGTSPGSIFAQWANLFSPRFWRMIYDIIRFNQYAIDILYDAQDSEDLLAESANGNGPTSKSHTWRFWSSKRDKAQTETIDAHLKRHGYSQAFRDDYLIPMTACVWSTDPKTAALSFPALTLIRFMYNHHLLSTFASRPSWMTIPGGSQRYIDAVMNDFPKENVHMNNPVINAEDINGKIILQFEDDTEDLFDHVILAVHGDTAASIIAASATEEERSIMSNFATNENVAYLHSDASPGLMPRRQNTWASWNFVTESTEDAANTDTVSLTYNMNILQQISRDEYGDVLVTLNPLKPPASDSIQGIFTYTHPLYTPAAIASQKALPRIQNTRAISYAGAWTKYGFHEDGLTSGLRVAIEHLGAEVPWDVVDSTFSRGQRPRITLGDWVMRLVLWLVGWWIWWVEPLWWLACLPFASLAWVIGAGKNKRRKPSQVANSNAHGSNANGNGKVNGDVKGKGKAE